MKRVRIVAAVLALLLAATLYYAWYIKGGIAPFSWYNHPDQREETLRKLDEAGFQNVRLVPLDSEEMDGLPWLETVDKISIDGDVWFDQGERFPSGVPVEVIYYRVPRKEIPLDSGEVQNYDLETIAQMFRDAGFTNLQIKEFYDLDPNSGAAFENEVRLEAADTFEKGESYPRSIPVLIAVHWPMPAHRVTIQVTAQDAVPARLFVDGEARQPGPDGVYDLHLAEGEHRLYFWGEDAATPGKEFALTVNSAMTVRCSLETGAAASLKELSIQYH